jgi:glycerophosphoryl diester phosphodiesterase
MGNWRAGLALAMASTVVLTMPASAEGARKCSAITHRAIYGDTENQVRGVKVAGRWGWAEVDARVTEDGAIVAVHDYSMDRLSGGESNTPVHRLTYDELTDLPYEYGRRVHRTGRLIRVALRSKKRIMVTINSWARVKDQGYADQTLDALWNAAKARPRKVFFGGAGARAAMEAAHPQARIFHRYEPGDHVRKHAKEANVDLVALPQKKHRKRLVRRLNRDGLIVTSTQLGNRRSVRRADRAGIEIVQVNNARRTVRRWCLKG